jgi:hypothetical protein
VRALIVAVINPDNTPHGYNWTYAFPMLLFIVTALVLWVLFGRPHHRVPGRPIALGSRRADAGAASAAPVAGGLGVAPASGASETDGASPGEAGDSE